MIYASGLLAVDESRFDEACALLAQACAPGQIEVQRGMGTAGRGPAGDRVALRQWIQEQRVSRVTSVSAAVQDGLTEAGRDTEGKDRVRQMLARFADGLPFLMRVDRAAELPVQVRGTVPRPHLSLTASIFLEVFNMQGEQGFFLPAVLAEINAYRANDDRDAIVASDLPS